MNLTYAGLVKAHFGKKNTEVMWENVELISQFLEEFKTKDKARFWKIMRDTHELMYGKHFDRMFAEWEVDKMFHKEDNGKIVRGEYWSLDQTTDVFSHYKSKLPQEVNEFDFYVALNNTYHDNVVWISKFASSDEVNDLIIENAIKTWFCDDDWPNNNKIWCYFRMKNM